MATKQQRKKSPYKDVYGIDIYEGDTVMGIGEHVGQSEVFFAHDVWQPFSYLNDYDGNNYRIIPTLTQTIPSGSNTVTNTEER